MTKPSTSIAPASAPPSSWSLLKPYVIDVFGPFLGYMIVHASGGPGVWALTAAGAIASLSAAINSLRRKGVDSVGSLVLLEIIVSIALAIFVRDPRLGLVRPSFYTAMAAIYLCFTAIIGEPLSYSGSRVMAARGGPARIAAYERAWKYSASFRQTHRAVTFAFGLGLAVDSILRVFIVYHTSIDRAAWLSNVPHLTAMALIIPTSALAGRRFKRLVDEHMEPVAP